MGDGLGLVADIGGTNARFALVDRAGAAQDLRDVHILRCADYPTLEDAVETYLDQAGAAARPRTAVIAVAGPVTGDVINLTNHVWRFSVSTARRHLGFDALEVANDFNAIAQSVPHLPADGLVGVGEVASDAPGRTAPGQRTTLAVLGPGTGLGAAGLLVRPDGPIVLESEAGHANFAPCDAIEVQISDVLLKRFPRVSNERLISGPGLRNLYEALVEIHGATAEILAPADITRRALDDADSLCVQTLERFCAILGSVAGDIALVMGAWGGVYIGGGIPPRIIDFLKRSDFRRRFEAKGRFEKLMTTIATNVIVHPHPGLIGAAAALLRMHDHAPSSLDTGAA